MNENDFTEAITTNLPEQPRTTSWGPQVRRRRRRQRATTGALALVAVAALAVPLALQLGGRGVTVQATPSPTSSPTTQATDEPVNPIPALLNPEGSGCRTSQGEPEERTALTGGKLEPGVSKIWLCGRDEVGPDRLPLLTRIGPFEPLTEGVETAVARFNEFEWLDGAAIGCHSDGRAFDVVFEYADGDKRVVSGYDSLGSPGCSHFASADGVGGDAPAYLAELEKLWKAQRETTPGITDDFAVCPGHDSLFTVDEAKLTRGYACVAGGSFSQRRIHDDLAATIIDGVAAAQPWGIQPLISSDKRIVLLTTHGEPLVLYVGGRELVWYNPALHRLPLTGAMAERVEELFGGTTRGPADPAPVSPEPAPTATGATQAPPVATLSPEPSPITPQDVSCDNLDSLQDAGLYQGSLPEGAVSALMCVVPVDGLDTRTPPTEPLVTKVDRVVTDFNALTEPAGTTCPADAGPDYAVVLTYGDNAVRVIRVQTAGCRSVSAGGLERAGADNFLEGLRGYWGGQRAMSGPMEVSQTFPDACDQGITPLMPFFSADVVAAAACIDGRPVGVHAEAVGAIVDAMAGAQVEHIESFSNRRLLLQTEFDDFQSAWFQDDESLVWEAPDGVGFLVARPTGQALTDLREAFGG